MKSILLLSMFILLTNCQSDNETLQSDEFGRLFETILVYEEEFDSFHEIAQGIHPDSIPVVTWDQLQLKKEKLSTFLTELNNKEISNISRQDQISLATMRLKLNAEIARIEMDRILIPFNAEGGFYNEIQYYTGGLPFATVEDYESYLVWMAQYPAYIEANVDLMKRGITSGVTAPRVIAKNTQKLLIPFIDTSFVDHPLTKMFSSFPASIDVGDQRRLMTQARHVFTTKLLPTYQNLDSFLSLDYLPASQQKVGISHIKNGNRIYEERVNFYSTLNITPDSIFTLGLSEVERIKKKMMKIISKLEYDGDYASFLNFLRTDPQFYPTSPQELLNYASWLSKKAEGQLPKLFNNLYTLPFTVAAVPDLIAPTYTTGRYVSGDVDLDLPGTYWVNTYNLKSRTLYTLPALTLHEAVPGHHLQGRRAAVQIDIPDFRKSYYISAYGEGWALYAEYLGEEMGMYEDPYDQFGRYTYEMWRACRLVVDVGMHYKNWTRQQAWDFMAGNTALSEHEITTEIDRYIGWPGQALSYKIGELTIKSLRKKSEVALGESFDIKEFHDVILKNGSIPLTELILEVNHWIEEVRKTDF